MLAILTLMLMFGGAARLGFELGSDLVQKILQTTSGRWLRPRHAAVRVIHDGISDSWCFLCDH